MPEELDRWTIVNETRNEKNELPITCWHNKPTVRNLQFLSYSAKEMIFDEVIANNNWPTYNKITATSNSGRMLWSPKPKYVPDHIRDQSVDICALLMMNFDAIPEDLENIFFEWYFVDDAIQKFYQENGYENNKDPMSIIQQIVSLLLKNTAYTLQDPIIKENLKKIEEIINHLSDSDDEDDDLSLDPENFESDEPDQPLRVFI